jgi:hypothetical protein
MELMKYSPILFSTPMVQAILNGSKIQTRRVIKPQPKESDYLPEILYDHFGKQFLNYRKDAVLVETKNIKCPYGQIGDVLWVRETFYKPVDFPFETQIYIYKEQIISKNIINANEIKWKPSIFMIKEACRLFLKIKDIRVERLRDISENDAVSEGVMPVDKKISGELNLYADYFRNTTGYVMPQSSFRSLWKSINGEESWEANPWVWVIEFERIEKPIDFC